MKVEALVPLEIRAGNTVFTVVPGQCLDLTEKQGRSLLAKVPDKVRVIEGDWLSAWRELAQLTYGLTEEDPRFEWVMIWLNVCDLAFLYGSWRYFCEAAEEIKRLVKATT
jgi:hypothetical protein